MNIEPSGNSRSFLSSKRSRASSMDRNSFQFEEKLFTVMSSPVCDEHHVEAGGIMNAGSPVRAAPSVITGYWPVAAYWSWELPLTCPSNERSACKPANLCRYLDSPGANIPLITVGGWIISPTHGALFGWFCTFSIGIHDLDWFLKPNISKYHHHRIRLIKLDDLSIPGGISCSRKILGRECRQDHKMMSWILFLFLMRISLYWPLTGPKVFYSWRWMRKWGCNLRIIADTDLLGSRRFFVSRSFAEFVNKIIVGKIQLFYNENNGGYIWNITK